MTEEWREIPGYGGYYEVSDQGNVRSLGRLITRSDGQQRRFRGKKMNPVQHECGYPLVKLSRGMSDRRQAYVHRLVLETFVGPCPEGMEACHNNGDPTDNRLRNLRWDTHSGNIRDVVAHGHHNNGTKTHCKFGHEFIPGNLYPRDLLRGRRRCVACHRAKGYLQKYPSRSDEFQKVADSYFDAISGGVSA